MRKVAGRDSVWRCDVLLLAGIAAIFFPMCLMGYGSDNDTYLVLEAGRSVWLHHVLITSRNPGYWFFEAVIFFLSHAGSYFLTNLVTLAVSVTLLWRFLALSRRLGIQFARLLTACLAALPVYVIASTSTNDYLWSLLGVLVMIEMIADDRWTLAAIAATLAYLFRVSNGSVIAGLIIGGLWSEWANYKRMTPRAWKMLVVGLLAAVVGSLPLIASYHNAGNSLSFLSVMTDSNVKVWTWKMRLGRFLYKGLLLFGVQAWATIGLVVWKIKGHTTDVSLHEKSYRARVIPMLVGGSAANLLLFLKFPLEISYLLPFAAFFLLWLGINLFERRMWPIAVVLVAIISSDLLTVQLATPDVSSDAKSAAFHPAVVAGQVVEDMRERLKVRYCRTSACWLQAQSNTP